MRDAPAPLVVALHGCTQTASDFAAGTRFDSVAERAGAYVLYPEQSVHANPRRCWNWFLEAHQQRESGEPAAILALVDEVALRYPIDRERIYVAGLSAGGAMAAILAERAPDVFAAAGIMAGVALHASHDVPSALAAMHGRNGFGPSVRAAAQPTLPPSAYERLRVSIWTGRDDRTVVPGNGARLAAQFRTLLALADDGRTEHRADADVTRWMDATGRARIESWSLFAMGHAWSGGSFRGSHTDPRGPRASDEMMAFFLSDGVPAAEPDFTQDSSNVAR